MKKRKIIILIVLSMILVAEGVLYFTGSKSYADISEKERKQCICFYNKFIVLYCFDSGLYCVGSGRVIKRKEGI